MDTRYSWPDLSSVIRRYVVRDDQGRYGIAYEDNVRHNGVLFAHPVDVPSITDNKDIPGAELLPADAILMTDTAWHLKDGGGYIGTWYDYNHIGNIPERDIRILTIVDDLGYAMPDKMAELLLAGSDEMGHWDAFWAGRLGKKGGASTSKAKAAASRSNGKLGGRPRKDKND